MSVALPLLGGIIVLAVLQDVFTTVLFPSSERGVLRKPTSRLVWHLFKAAASALSSRRRRRLLTFSGPVIISVNLASWVVLMVTGFALIYQPALGEAIRTGTGTTDTSWTTAAYYSGFVATTLGVGDVFATTGIYRLLTVAQAALGFAGITMAITYFLSVYGNLAARNAGAQALHHRTRGLGDSASFVAGLADGGDLAEGREMLSTTAGYLRHICQSHSFFPVLRYFHYADHAYALPRILLLTFDATTLLRTTVDRGRYDTILRSRSLEEVELASSDLLDQLVGDAADVPGSDESEDRWRRRHAAAVAVLRDAEIDVDPDPSRYVALRRAWDPRVRKLAEMMAYDWSEIDVTGSRHVPQVDGA